MHWKRFTSTALPRVFCLRHGGFAAAIPSPGWAVRRALILFLIPSGLHEQQQECPSGHRTRGSGAVLVAVFCGDAGDEGGTGASTGFVAPGKRQDRILISII